MNGNGKRIIYHNEMYFRVPRPVKRRLIEIAKEKGVKPEDILKDITTTYVIDNTPKNIMNKSIKSINNWFGRNASAIYKLYSYAGILMIAIIFIAMMNYFTQSIFAVTIYIACAIVLLIFTKVILMIAKD